MNILENILYKNWLFPFEFILEDLKTYYKTIIQTLENAAKEFENDFSNKVKELEKAAEKEANKPENKGLVEFKSGYFECGFNNLYGEYINRTTKFPNYFRSFFLTQMCSFIESEIKYICKYLHDNKKPTSDFKDTITKYGSLSNTERYLKYLEEYAGLDLSTLKDEISFLKTAVIIRNIIVHDSNIIKTKSKNKWNVIKRFEEESHHIKLETTSEENAYEIIICNDDLILKTIDISMHIFNKIIENFRNNNILLMKSPKCYFYDNFIVIK